MSRAKRMFIGIVAVLVPVVAFALSYAGTHAGKSDAAGGYWTSKQGMLARQVSPGAGLHEASMDGRRGYAAQAVPSADGADR